MWFLSWLRNRTHSLKSRRTHRSNTAPRFRPHLEALEDRCLLSGGVLDPTFGTAGVVLTSVAGAGSAPSAVAAYSNAGTANDGKIVAVGPSSTPNILRYNLDGTLDRSFGGSGQVTNAGTALADVKVQPDGKIVAAGTANNGGSLSSNFGVVRYNADGSLDTSFGGKAGKGRVTTDIKQKSGDFVQRLALQKDGKIVVAGSATYVTSTGFFTDLALVRYNADGSLDAAFGTGGKVTQHFARSLQGGAYSMDMTIDPGMNALDPSDDKIVVVANLNTSPAGVVVRFNTNGSLDTSFGGSAGYVTLGWPDGNREVAVQLDGRIVVGGNISLARLKTDGTPDLTFGSGGIAPLTNGARSVTIQPDGKLVVAGYSSVARYNGADGSLDSSFGVNGVAVVTGVSVTDVALEPDGRIVVAGTAFNGGIFSFALARFLAAGPQIGTFTASPSPVTAGSSVTLTASDIQDLNSGSSVTQVAFYQDANGDGTLQTNTDTFLGYGAQTSPGVWTFTFSTSGLPGGTYTLFAQAKDNYGVFGDPLAITETVIGDPLAITEPVS